ncbi:MAG TPA: hydroxymethylpyrimidine/phosphomethylpyrimidine kinase [Burkholderiales bacterium]|nr:hydroxymethylpyrimidine/phosphomethylpyrimidine kinase [Burkholderiales bacterium]
MVLTFAASDPTGGAGLQADLLTIAALGCHPLSVVTGLTVQDTVGVARMFALDPAWIRDQAKCLLDDMEVAAFKAGVLGSAANVRAVSEIVAAHSQAPFVVDPVLASGRGDPLTADGALGALRKLILPRTTVLTPNSIEARRLAAPDTDLAACARRMVGDGCKYVLITGTHEPGPEVVNTLYDERGIVREDRWPRLPASYHGSGCTLASAIAARLAHNADVVEAVREAQKFTWQSLAAGFRAGAGQLLPNRFFRQ